jgi:isopentenyl diphosphate isomerase/L-lactate dehydrogenase-like FMN-dependent dehydrogenase
MGYLLFWGASLATLTAEYLIPDPFATYSDPYASRFCPQGRQVVCRGRRDGLEQGGRRGAPATIDVLASITVAVGDRVEVLVDGGIRRGTDIVKALALGARAVQVGRPILWGLAVAGEQGVADTLDILHREFDLAMALTGCRSVLEITADLVHP